jgi:hypothetical protein
MDAMKGLIVDREGYLMTKDGYYLRDSDDDSEKKTLSKKDKKQKKAAKKRNGGFPSVRGA